MTWPAIYNFDLEEFDHATGKYKAYNGWFRLSQLWREKHEKPLDQISWATYVLTISNPFTIDYPNNHSPVVYIGKGMAHSRFKEHITEKLLPTIESLKGARFDFHLLECSNDEECKATEAKMLDYFLNAYGQLPLFNKHSVNLLDEGLVNAAWYGPLDRRTIGRGRKWKIRRV